MRALLWASAVVLLLAAWYARFDVTPLGPGSGPKAYVVLDRLTGTTRFCEGPDCVITRDQTLKP
jgi:hypothetical protein